MSTTFLIFIAIVFLANLTEAIAGFGSTLLAITFGSHFYSVQELVTVLVPLNLILSAALVYRHHSSIEKRILFTRILPFTCLGLPIGIALFQLAPGPALKCTFGIIVTGLAAFEIWNIRSPGTEVPLTGWKASFFLISGGIMQGLYASGGPFIVYHASRTLIRPGGHGGKSGFRSTLCLLWLILNLFVVGTLAASGKITHASLKMSATLLPFVILGLVVGEKIHHRISEKHFLLGVYVLLFFAGISLIF